MTIHRTREYGAGNGCDGSRLCGAASRLTRAIGNVRRYVPKNFPRVAIDSREATACRGIGAIDNFTGSVSPNFLDADVGDGGINRLSIGRRAPVNSAKVAALADSCLPKNRSIVIRIKRSEDPGLLSGKQGSLPVAEVYQDRGEDPKS